MSSVKVSSVKNPAVIPGENPPQTEGNNTTRYNDTIAHQNHVISSNEKKRKFAELHEASHSSTHADHEEDNDESETTVDCGEPGVTVPNREDAAEDQEDNDESDTTIELDESNVIGWNDEAEDDDEEDTTFEWDESNVIGWNDEDADDDEENPRSEEYGNYSDEEWRNN
jgi:hypothetical protein